MDILKDLYKTHTGFECVACEPIPGAGSNRKYYRLTCEKGNPLIGVVGTSRDENHAFCYLSKHFITSKLPVPHVHAISDDGLCYLQDDLGDTTLFDALKAGRDAGGRYTSHEKELLRRTIAALPDIQIRGGRNLDFSHCYPQSSMDTTNVLFDLNYFKYCFLKATGVDFHELKLEASFQLMSRDIANIPSNYFMYRDFQSRNVMVDKDGNPHFIDFQGGRKGPLQYDLASFLWQASAKYSKDLRNELIEVYLTNLKHYIEVDERKFRKDLQLCILFRLLQVLGAYGFRGYFERKKHFLDSIPPALDNLRDLLNNGGCPYPYLTEILNDMVNLPQFAPIVPETKKRADGYKITENNPYNAHIADGPATFSKYDGKGPLVVKVFSFSYRSGIPEDESGNGGGYVFDCRSTHNPGRYEPYKKLTGLDEPVIRFLEDDGEILVFLHSIYRLADAHIQRYIQRGFTSLMFSFGCTGGQHRSVTLAGELYNRLKDKGDYGLTLRHRDTK